MITSTSIKQATGFFLGLILTGFSTGSLSAGKSTPLKNIYPAEESNSTVKGKEFTSLELKSKAVAGIGLGQAIETGIIVKTDKNKEYRTPGFPEEGSFRTIAWDQFGVEVEGGTFADGKVIISSNFADIKQHEVKVKAYLLKNPELKSELVLHLDYKGEMLADFSGTAGKPGRNGQSGQRGDNGSSSTSPRDGGNGGQGGNGGDGAQGQDIEVFAKIKPDPILKKDLLEVRVKSKTTGVEQVYLVDPDGGKLKVSTDGGRGGSGGTGGYGGPGGSNSYSKTSGNGGNAGFAGNGGNGARGGSITVYLDPGTDKIPAGTLTFSNEGGAGGNRGQAGVGGAKGDYPSNWGQHGAPGFPGNSGTKGPEIKIIKQKL